MKNFGSTPESDRLRGLIRSYEVQCCCSVEQRSYEHRGNPRCPWNLAVQAIYNLERAHDTANLPS